MEQTREPNPSREKEKREYIPSELSNSQHVVGMPDYLLLFGGGGSILRRSQ
jgi:hypothetical protein